MATGTVKWFNSRWGFGFIVPDDGPGDVFVHYSCIVSDRRWRELSAGERVEFDLHAAPKGPQALQVRAISPD